MLFFLTLFDINHMTEARPVPRARRAGYFTQSKDASDALVDNARLLSSNGTNTYAVIEKINPGLFSESESIVTGKQNGRAHV